MIRPVAQSEHGGMDSCARQIWLLSRPYPFDNFSKASEMSKSRFYGALGGGIVGFLVGSGTGIVGGIFGAVAGASIFTLIGALWGFSAGPDLAKLFARLRR